MIMTRGTASPADGWIGWMHFRKRGVAIKNVGRALQNPVSTATNVLAGTSLPTTNVAAALASSVPAQPLSAADAHSCRGHNCHAEPARLGAHTQVPARSPAPQPAVTAAQDRADQQGQGAAKTRVQSAVAHTIWGATETAV